MIFLSIYLSWSSIDRVRRIKITPKIEDKISLLILNDSSLLYPTFTITLPKVELLDYNFLHILETSLLAVSLCVRERWRLAENKSVRNWQRVIVRRVNSHQILDFLRRHGENSS